MKVDNSATRQIANTSRNAIKKVKLIFPSDLTQSSSSSQVAKQVVRMAMLEMVGALGQTLAVDDSIEPNAISDDNGSANSILNFQTLRLDFFPESGREGFLQKKRRH